MKPRGDGGAADGNKRPRSWGAARALCFPPRPSPLRAVVPLGPHGWAQWHLVTAELRDNPRSAPAEGADLRRLTGSAVQPARGIQ